MDRRPSLWPLSGWLQRLATDHPYRAGLRFGTPTDGLTDTRSARPDVPSDARPDAHSGRHAEAVAVRKPAGDDPPAAGLTIEPVFSRWSLARFDRAGVEFWGGSRYSPQTTSSFVGT